MLFQQILRVGQVSSIDPKKMSCKVAFDDLDGMVSAEMQIIVPFTEPVAREYRLPTEGEHVLCLYMPNGIQEGFIIGSYYTAENLPTDPGRGFYRKEFTNGKIRIEVDTNSQTLTVSGSDYINVHNYHDISIDCGENVNISIGEKAEINVGEDTKIELKKNLNTQIDGETNSVFEENVNVLMSKDLSVIIGNTVKLKSELIKAKTDVVFFGNIVIKGDLKVDGRIHSLEDITTEQRVLERYSDDIICNEISKIPYESEDN